MFEEEECELDRNNLTCVRKRVKTQLIHQRVNVGFNSHAVGYCFFGCALLYMLATITEIVIIAKTGAPTARHFASIMDFALTRISETAPAGGWVTPVLGLTLVIT